MVGHRCELFFRILPDALTTWAERLIMVGHRCELFFRILPDALTTWADPEAERTGGWNPYPGKSHVGIGFP